MNPDIKGWLPSKRFINSVLQNNTIQSYSTLVGWVLVLSDFESIWSTIT